MPRTEFKLQPQTGLLITGSPTYTAPAPGTLTAYYQPLLTPDALALFWALVDRISPHPRLSERGSHTDLLDQVGTDIAALDRARKRLEGVGLLRTFFQVDAMGPVALYQLQAPLSPAAFIKDDLLSVLLLERVGERRYRELVARAAQWQLDPSGFQEVTAGTLEVFAPQPNPANQRAVSAAKQTLGEAAAPPLPAATTTIDWPFLAQQTTPLGLAAAELTKHRKLIAAEKQVYGLTELQLAPLLARATDLNGHLEPDRLKRLVRQVGKSSPGNPLPPQPAPSPVIPDAAPTPVSNQARTLVNQADRYAPLEYLQALKAGTNSGFVSSAEKNTLERLATQTSLTSGAINVLAHYVIVEQGKANLTANLANAIANNWTRQGVRTATDAVAALGRYWAKDRQPQPHSRQKRRGGTKEHLPDWAKHPQKRTDDRATAAQIEQGKALLAKFRAHQQKHDKRP